MKKQADYVWKVNLDFSRLTVRRLLCNSTRAVTSVASLTIPNNPLYGPCLTITVCPIVRSRPPVLMAGGGGIIPAPPGPPILLCIAGFILFRSGPLLVILAPFAATVARFVVFATNTPRFSFNSRLYKKAKERWMWRIVP